MIEWNGREMIGELPEECVLDCSTPGQDAAEPVAYWRERLSFAPPRGFAVEYLRGFGSWEDLDSVDDETIAGRVLWIFAGDARDALASGEAPIYYLGS
jgi:hypothetical protein